jgi:hypothetical protein
VLPVDKAGDAPAGQPSITEAFASLAAAGPSKKQQPAKKRKSADAELPESAGPSKKPAAAAAAKKKAAPAKSKVSERAASALFLSHVQLIN